MSQRLGRLGVLFLFLMMLAPAQVIMAGSTTFDISPSGDVIVGTQLTLHCKADEGTTRYEISGSIRSTDSFNEFGGPDNTGYVKTEEWGVGTLTITCAIRHSNNDWNSAERITKSLQVLPAPAQSPSQPQQQTGGLNFQGFCKEHMQLDRVGGNPANAYDLLCAGGDKEVRFSASDVCAWQYGGALPYAGLANAGDRNSWTCNALQTYVAPENVNPNNGSSNNNSNNGNNNQNQNNQNNSQQNNSGGNSAPAQDNSCGGGLVSVGDTAVVLPGDPNNVRSGPSKGSGFVTKMNAGSQFTVIGGPACADGYRWWQVRFNGQEGWTAEGDGSSNWIQRVSGGQSSAPAQPQGPSNQNSGQSSDAACNTPAPVSVGNLARVLPGPKNNVRSQPSQSSGVIAQIPAGDTFSVIGGPQCADGFRFWQVSYNGVIGWTAEGNAGENWIEYAGGGQSQQPANSGTEYITVNFYDGPFTLQYDRAAHLILNGAELTQWEINDMLARMKTPSNLAEQGEAFWSAFQYNMELAGAEEKIREVIEPALCGSDTQCSKQLRYVIGGQKMDTSGPGNIVFGFTCEKLGVSQESIENPLSIAAQIVSSFFREHKVVKDDYPDDKNQRKTGRTIFILAGNSPSVSDIARAADIVKGLDQ